MNKAFFIVNILKSQAVTELRSAVKDTVMNTLADAGSLMSGYMEKQRVPSSGRRSGQSSMTHEQWKAEAIQRCLRDRQ